MYGKDWTLAGADMVRWKREKRVEGGGGEATRSGQLRRLCGEEDNLKTDIQDHKPRQGAHDVSDEEEPVE